MKVLVNVSVDPYLALSNGATIPKGGTMKVLNEAILLLPEIQNLIAKGRIRIEERPDALG